MCGRGQGGPMGVITPSVCAIWKENQDSIEEIDLKALIKPHGGQCTIFGSGRGIFVISILDDPLT